MHADLARRQAERHAEKLGEVENFTVVLRPNTFSARI